MERESMCGGAGDERELNPYSGDRVTWEKKIFNNNKCPKNNSSYSPFPFYL